MRKPETLVQRGVQRDNAMSVSAKILPMLSRTAYSELFRAKENVSST